MKRLSHSKSGLLSHFNRSAIYLICWPLSPKGTMYTNGANFGRRREDPFILRLRNITLYHINYIESASAIDENLLYFTMVKLRDRLFAFQSCTIRVHRFPWDSVPANDIKRRREFIKVITSF